MATFTGLAVFDGAEFAGVAYFGGVTFEDAGFGGATFAGVAYFGGVTFEDAGFGGATFAGTTDFGGATFTGTTDFGGARVDLSVRRVVLPRGWITRLAAEGEEEGWLYVVRDEDSSEQAAEAPGDGPA